MELVDSQVRFLRLRAYSSLLGDIYRLVNFCDAFALRSFFLHVGAPLSYLIKFRVVFGSHTDLLLILMVLGCLGPGGASRLLVSTRNSSAAPANLNAGNAE